ncbi:MAG: 4-hydroxybenzoate octaprenyltransferase [Rhodospirillaceae bacterium]|nr:4-hydroxybenzoate octaprenyltransferase [Rhodospirillaceae bacterium]|tara:strand:- start:4537 stop:5487 length:951 start_codon:yes stop_codon:yes gene_type:complete
MSEQARNKTDDSASDIPVNGWVERYMPVSWHPYIRLARFDRPIGTWLLLFPCWWSIAMAWPSAEATAEILYLFAAFGIGALVMRGAGCTYNDIVDRDFDAQVARTKNRPLPSGQVTIKEASGFLIALLIIGFLILLTLKNYAIAVGAASLVLVFTYPLMKRVTFWPQFFLGLAFNWGALLGWAAVREDISLPAILLYLGGIFWTLGYDTIYAHQDRQDDPKAGVKSTARRLGLGSKPWLYAFYLMAAVFFAFAGKTAEFGWPFYVGLGLGAFQLVWQVWDVDINNPKDCLAKFKSNRLFSWLFLSGIVADQIISYF